MWLCLFLGVCDTVRHSWEITMKIVKIIVTLVLLAVTFFAGIWCGVVMEGYNRPIGVISTDIMWNSWEGEFLTVIENELIREGIAPDSEQGKQHIRAVWGDFEPMVFCHPFLILKRRDNSGYRVFKSTDIDNTLFSNFALPTLDFNLRKDHAGTLLGYSYLFATPPRMIEETSIGEFMALVLKDKENNRVSTLVDLVDAENNTRFWYRDLNADGVFESIIYFDSLVSNDSQTITQYNLSEFAEKFCCCLSAEKSSTQ